MIFEFNTRYLLWFYMIIIPSCWINNFSSITINILIIQLWFIHRNTYFLPNFLSLEVGNSLRRTRIHQILGYNLFFLSLFRSVRLRLKFKIHTNRIWINSNFSRFYVGEWYPEEPQVAHHARLRISRFLYLYPKHFKNYRISLYPIASPFTLKQSINYYPTKFYLCTHFVYILLFYSFIITIIIIIIFIIVWYDIICNLFRPNILI